MPDAAPVVGGVVVGGVVVGGIVVPPPLLLYLTLILPEPSLYTKGVDPDVLMLNDDIITPNIL